MEKYQVRNTLTDHERMSLGKYSNLLSHLLFHRGVKDMDSAESFLQPDYTNHTHDPLLLKDIDKTTDRILSAIKNDEKVVVYGDYDADGIPASVIFHDYFKKIGFKNFTNYIPHRHNEGFGLNMEAVQQFLDDKMDLLITIDCGISDVEAIKLAKKSDLDVIVIDHHLPGVALPLAYSIINPKQSDCAYPEKMLCAAGLSYKVVQALLAKERFGVSEGWEKWLLDMVGIATLSDMVPLTGENRVFAYYGLSVLRKSRRKGLLELIRHLKITQRNLTEDDIGFSIVPRINAASRMDKPMDAFNLLATEDDAEAEELVQHLDNINNERKGTVASLVKEVKKHVKERYGQNPEEKVIVVGNPSWKPSLLGLAANSCAEEYKLPVFLWGRDGGDVIRGSCRAGGAVHLVKLMQAVPANTFVQFGGHAESGGFALESQAVHTLEEKLNLVFVDLKKELSQDLDLIDRDLTLEEVDYTLYRDIEKLAPFGMGNPKPVFIFRDAKIAGVKEFGKEKNHLELSFRRQNGAPINAIGFFMTATQFKNEFGQDVQVGDSIDLIASIEKSNFRGREELRLRIVDVLPKL